MLRAVNWIAPLSPCQQFRASPTRGIGRTICRRRSCYPLSHPKPVRHFRCLNIIAAADTIYALSSGPVGQAGVSVVRVSGPDSSLCYKHLTGKEQLPTPRQAVLRSLFRTDRVDTRRPDELLDRALVLWFPRPNSFTGEDVLELHLHGSRAVVSSVLQVLGEVSAQVRPAERGEFSRRAYENGKMDLTEVEGLADLIAAETAAQRRLALLQMGGSLKSKYETWRADLKTCLAYAEAVIDFGEDVDESALEEIVPKVDQLRKDISGFISDRRRGELVRSGVRVVIAGPPNAGKSTLLNILARRPAAIVSPIAGTTRDVVEVHLDLAGYAVIVSDTAGLRTKTEDPIEMEGIRRARQVAEEAHFVVLVVDVSHADPGLTEVEAYMDEWTERNPDLTVLTMLNKTDCVGGAVPKRPGCFLVSCKTGEGITEFLEHLESSIRAYFETNDESPVITRERHRRHLSVCHEALSAFMSGYQVLPLDIATEELRIAANELGKVTGVIHVEEVLDTIFSTFCIGK